MPVSAVVVAIGRRTGEERDCGGKVGAASALRTEMAASAGLTRHHLIVVVIIHHLQLGRIGRSRQSSELQSEPSQCEEFKVPTDQTP